MAKDPDDNIFESQTCSTASFDYPPESPPEYSDKRSNIEKAADRLASRLEIRLKGIDNSLGCITIILFAIMLCLLFRNCSNG
jgi:hypothetical protein